MFDADVTIPIVEYSLRPALEEEKEWLFQLKCEGLRPYVEAIWGWDLDWQRRNFDSNYKTGEWQVVELGGERVGSLLVIEEPDRIYLANIYVVPEIRSKGLGSALVRDSQELARAAAKPLHLQVLRSNLRARALYERLGFQVVGEKEHHFQMRWEA